MLCNKLKWVFWKFIIVWISCLTWFINKESETNYAVVKSNENNHNHKEYPVHKSADTDALPYLN